MKKYPAYWFMTLALLVLIGSEGCGNPEGQLPEVVIDRSECAKCRMLISDARFAGMIKTDDYLMFDDLGCMLKFEQQAAEKEITGMWVRDYFTNTWISKEVAVFYRIDSIATPMEYGYIATTASGSTGAHRIATRLADSKALATDFAQRFTNE